VNISRFTYSRDPEPHKARTKTILKAHPDIRKHIGKNPYSFLAIVALVSLQIGLAALLTGSPWWLIFLTAYTVGAIADHGLFVLIHECAHNLIFKVGALNTLAGIVANVPSVIPSAVSFKRYHLKHHAFQGVYELDADIPSEWEARLIGNSPIGKAFWLLLFPVFQMLRPFRIKELSLVDRQVAVNMSVVFAADAILYMALGPRAFVYLLASVFFSVGLHPVGARWIQRHWLVESDQETYSYYGRMNLLAFNVGYHNEHHDFPSVPWNRLPKVKATAPECYKNLAAHTSWTRLLLRFMFDRKLSLFSRMVREERAGRPISDQSTPDIELIQPASGSMRGRQRGRHDRCSRL
jgi:sphingolipid delta-4 desaturase